MMKAYKWIRNHFRFGKPALPLQPALKEGIFPLLGMLLITGALVALFALFLHLGRDMEPVIMPHVDDGELVDPSPMRLAYMLFAFVLSLVFAHFADRRDTMTAFWLGYAGGTMFWQSLGECSWHFSIPGEDYLTCFPHIEGPSALLMVVVCLVLLFYCFRRRAFSWGVWIFVLTFIGNWFGHFIHIGSYPLAGAVMEEQTWFHWVGWVVGVLTMLVAVVLNFTAARSRKARLCCCLMLYFGIGMIVTGVAGI